MLEKFSKNSKNFFFDAHFHYAVCREENLFDISDDEASEVNLNNWKGISCAHSIKEYEIQKTAPDCVIQAYGMHPQNAAYENIEESTAFLESLLEGNKIELIGEAGFDYFSDEFKLQKQRQEEIFNIQLELALKYNKPLVIHCRKANDKLFEYAKKLKKLPEVLFHSFMGTTIEAESLLKRGINGYFSFGKQIFNNNKKVIECAKLLPEERLLAETDAPFQYLKGESFTRPSEIKKITDGLIQLR